MHDYFVFGDVLRSRLAFPELAPAPPRPPRWSLVEDADSGPVADAELLGSDAIEDGVEIRLFRTNAGLALWIDDTGIFRIEREGRVIRWTPGPDPDPEKVRADVLGPVLAIAQHAAGRFVLHGSAVVLGGEAIALVGPKHHGKSTLALALVQQGARLLTDDSLPVDLDGATAMAAPGVHSVRLWSDSRRELAHDAGRTLTGAGGKLVLAGLPPASLALGPTPLTAVYLLRPIAPENGTPPARREPVPARIAALALVRNAKPGALVGKSEGPALLDRAAGLADCVPVFVLSVVRDFGRLDEVASRLGDWHAGAAASDAAAGAS